METTAQEIMSTELLTLREGATVEDVVKILINSRVTGLPVVDDKGRMLGIVSEYDVIRQVSEHRKLRPEIFSEAAEFTRDADCIPASTPLPEIIRLFVEKKFRRLPVTDAKGKLVGIITRRDLMRIFYYRAKLS